MCKEMTKMENKIAKDVFLLCLCFAYVHMFSWAAVHWALLATVEQWEIMKVEKKERWDKKESEWELKWTKGEVWTVMHLPVGFSTLLASADLENRNRFGLPAATWLPFWLNSPLLLDQYH